MNCLAVQASANRIYLSPHLDDAVLSCGGTIWQQVQAGDRVLVLTVFAGSPPPGAELSPFVRELHSRWAGLDDVADIDSDRPRSTLATSTPSRRDEDLTALARLGADACHWPYADCIYRQAADGRFLYPDEKALWGEMHSADGGLIGELVGRLTRLPLARDSTLYAPLGVGHHVDHQVVRRAAEGSGRTLTYYEDFPYAEDTEGVRAALGDRRARADIVSLSEEALRAKTAAIACYRSQISTFWDNGADMAASIRAFAQRHGGGAVERYWMLDA